MAEVNEKVMQMVEDELSKNANVSNADLLEKAKKIDRGVEKLSARQFNAIYPLQVKRRMRPRRRRSRTAASQTAARRAARTAGGGHEAVRQVLLQFAKELTSAKDTGQIVALVADIDKYVDRVVKARGER